MTAFQRAPFATNPKLSRGRQFDELESSTRTCFQRDLDRIIHSTGFRRLEYKTQVFVNHEGDHYRTRLTHSLEVAQIARSIARSLYLDEDLAEALALAHDLGHTPFGHAGEDALSKMMEDYGGFDHNAQSLAIVTRLEKRYPNFDGLNLTWETLEGLVKHNGPLVAGEEEAFPVQAIADFSRKYDLELHTYAGAEAQVAALADDIAYNNHDIDDGLRAGLFNITDIGNTPLVGEIFQSVAVDHPKINQSRQIHEAIRRLIGNMIDNCLTETRKRIKKAAPKSVNDIRALDYPVVSFSDDMVEIEQSLKEFLFGNMYRHKKVTRMTSEADKVVCSLFEIFINNPKNLPEEWQATTDTPCSDVTAHTVADYIAGMTDRFALDEYAKLVESGVIKS